MKTILLGIANYCVPCHTHCRHCLLSSCGKITGVDFDRGLEFGERVFNELVGERKDIKGNYYIGYCMDTPRLFDYIGFCKRHSLYGARFLQMNGFKPRKESEIDILIKSLKNAGIEMIDLTFFGLEDYHDRFAGSKGDFAFLIKMLTSACRHDLQVSISIPLLRENLPEMTELRKLLDERGATKYSYFLPHSKGRGRFLEDQRITKQEFETLPENIKASFQKIKHMTEAEWIMSDEITEPHKRSLTLVLTPENIDHFEGMSVSEIINELEIMDDEFLKQIPSVRELAERYGRKDSQQLYRYKDLLLRWRQEYLRDFRISMYDMQDEAHTFSMHM